MVHLSGSEKNFFLPFFFFTYRITVSETLFSVYEAENIQVDLKEKKTQGTEMTQFSTPWNTRNMGFQSAVHAVQVWVGILCISSTVFLLEETNLQNLFVIVSAKLPCFSL